MNIDELKRRLDFIVKSADLIGESEKLINDLQSSESGLEAVSEILRCMEVNPTVDFGAPGPFVHFVERFYKRGYEGELLKSIMRQPTPHTVWMLNRVINGTKNIDEVGKLIGIMKSVVDNKNVDEATKAMAKHFLERMN